MLIALEENSPNPKTNPNPNLNSPWDRDKVVSKKGLNMLYTIETFFQGKKVSNVAFNVLKRDFQWLQLSFAEAFSFKSRIFENFLLYIIGKYMPNYKHYQHIFA